MGLETGWNTAVSLAEEVVGKWSWFIICHVFYKYLIHSYSLSLTSFSSHSLHSYHTLTHIHTHSHSLHSFSFTSFSSHSHTHLLRWTSWMGRLCSTASWNQSDSWSSRDSRQCSSPCSSLHSFVFIHSLVHF